MNAQQKEHLRQRLELVTVTPAEGVTVYNVCSAPGYYVEERGHTCTVAAMLLAEHLHQHVNMRRWGAPWDNVHIAIVTQPRPHLGNPEVVRSLDGYALDILPGIEAQTRLILGQDDGPGKVGGGTSGPEARRQYHEMLNPNHNTSGSRAASRNRSARSTPRFSRR